MAEGWGTKIALLPSGSRGDTQPYIALGLALRRAGYHVLVITDQDSEPYFKEWGLDTVAARYGYEEKLSNSRNIDMMTSGSLLHGGGEMSEEEAKKLKEEGEQEFEALKYFLGEFKPTAMVINSVAMHEGRKLECQLRIPLIEVHLSPQHMPTEEFAPVHLIETVPLLEPDTPVGATWAMGLQNSARMVHLDEISLMAQGLSSDDILFHMILQGSIHTPEMMYDWWFKAEEAPIPTVFAHSEHFWARPAEWSPEGIKITGNWKICKEDQIGHAEQDGCKFFGSQEDLQRCQAFIAAGEPPVYVGWGSMIVRHPLTMSYLAMKAVKLAGRRGILVKGWSKLSLDDIREQPDAEEVLAWAADNIIILDLAPHEWLLPQCACVVHHGGCGTCHASLSAGTPAVVTPVFLDQYSNGEHIQSQKLGMVTSRLGIVTPEDLAERIRICCTDEEIKANCARTRELMAQENGTENMVSFIGEVVKGINEGQWEAKYNARIENQEARRKKRLGLPVDAAVAQIDRQVKQALPEYKKYAERQAKQFMEMNEAIKSDSLFYVKASTGVVAREGEGLKSPELGRLKENAILVKLEQKGNRMKVKRLRGHGPNEGWVSTSVSGKDVLGKLSDMSELRPIQEALFNAQFGRAGYVA